MAIQAHINPENFGSLPISSPNLFSMNDNNFFNNNNNNNLQHKLLLQQQFQQQQQQYMLHVDNMKRRNFCNDGFVFLQPSKKQKLPANPTTAATTATTTSTTTTTTTSGADNYIPVNVSQSLSLQLEKQSYEIDRLIVLQNERLKLALHEERKRQMRLIVKSLEAKAMRLLKQKDDEIAYATKKSMELQEIVSKMEIENQTWQNIASQNEAMVFSLSNTLEQLQQQQQQQQQQQGPCCSQSSSNVVDDAESCCEILEDDKKKSISRKVETEENRGVFGFENEKPTTATTTKAKTRGGVLLLLCKVCKSRKTSVLLLPCRHMCCCKVCDESIHACPLCKSPKMASIEALFE